MKKMINRSLFLLAGLTFVFASCGKYEDGPGLSLLTKKARLSGTWDPVEYVDGTDGQVTADSNTDTFTLDKDGTYTYTSGSTTYTGTWQFANDKEQLQATVTYSLFGQTQSITTTSIITRLTSKELWMKDPDTGDVSKCEKK